MKSLAAAFALTIAGAALAGEIVTPEEHRRAPDQTFLTFPEWFLVHSPAEFAEFTEHRPPSDFPWFGHIGQFWSSYATVTSAISEYPFNFGYHVMIMVIGVSTTVEYAIRSLYEGVVGRLTALTVDAFTDEDRFAAMISQDYVDFIRELPWYEYDFADKLVRLWRETPLWGQDPLRKWERKYALTTEYLVKAGYGWLIKKGTRAAYDPALLVTAIVIDRLPPGLETQLPKLEVLSTRPDGAVVALVPRYEAFKVYSGVLSRNGAQFREIAGNDGDILVTALVPANWLPEATAEVLFTQPVLTRPDQKRVALVVAVTSLHLLLTSLDRPGIVLEHVYDY